MKVGLTYDLRAEYLEMGFTDEETAEFDSIETIEALHEAISGLGHEVEKIGNIYELVNRLVSGRRWDLVFNIAEGISGRGREAQVPALLEAYNIPYTFSDPLTLALSLDKAMAKNIVKAAGIPTPEFFTVNSLDNLNGDHNLAYPLFVKPVCEGTGKGISRDSIVWNREGLKRQCKKLLFRYNQPVLVERCLTGREFTVGITGTDRKAEVIGVLEVKLLRNAERNVYSFVNKQLYEDRVKYSLVKSREIIKEASEIALGAYRALGCRDAGRADLRADKSGRLYFIEMNPLAGLHPVHSDLVILCGKAGISYMELISRILESAGERNQEPATILSHLKAAAPSR